MKIQFSRIEYADIVQARFWSYVDKWESDQCWSWLGGRDEDGYGYFFVKDASRKAHRVAYVIHHGELDTFSFVCHTCDNPSCVNSAHLWAGSSRQNIDDMIIKERSLVGVRNPKAKLTEADVHRIICLSNDGLYGTEIARKIGCNRRTVSNILLGKQWSSVTGVVHA